MPTCDGVPLGEALLLAALPVVAYWLTVAAVSGGGGGACADVDEWWRAAGRRRVLVVLGTQLAQATALVVLRERFCVATWFDVWLAGAPLLAVACARAAQLLVAAVALDALQYHAHRAMHTPWLYAHVHRWHHELRAPRAYAALYNHPLESLLVDALGAVLVGELAALSPRWSVAFSCAATVKTVADHAGRARGSARWRYWPTANDATYHAIHHERARVNFSQPFFTVWDHVYGTTTAAAAARARPRADRLNVHQ